MDTIIEINGKKIVASGSIPVERSDRTVSIECGSEKVTVILGYEGNFTAREPASVQTFPNHYLQPGHFITKSLSPGSKYVFRCCLESYSDLSPAFFVLSYIVVADEN